MCGLLKTGMILVLIGVLTWSVVWSAEPDRLEWVWLSPDARAQTSYVLELRGAQAGARTGMLTREFWDGGKRTRQQLNLEAPVVKYLLGLSGGKELGALRWSGVRGCDRSAHWEIVHRAPRASKPEVIPLCGEGEGAQRIARLSRAAQGLSRKSRAGPEGERFAQSNHP